MYSWIAAGTKKCACTLYSALRPANLRLCVYTLARIFNVRVHMELTVIHALLFG
jgi:hypothetical protein